MSTTTKPKSSPRNYKRNSTTRNQSNLSTQPLDNSQNTHNYKPRNQQHSSTQPLDSQHNSQHNSQLNFKQLYYNLLKREHSPKVDLIENDNLYIIRIDSIGKDINIELHENKFFLMSFNRPDFITDFITDDCYVIYTESKFGKITRRVKLPSIITSFTYYFADGSWFVECIKEKNIK